ncbi:hypothetical protein A9K55_002061 [Cordyceps militaris]|uniref:Uncharacterized protein n=1 Tax=Cordyceps militaris TaxID=73501 RepID=A0A2H4SQL6_CORMI|nr:hypothetical protein A9K55_002061 [Cordyceps militaris]
MAVPHHRHQASLESIFRVSSSPPLEAAQRNQAHGRFQEILDHYEGTVPPNRQYKRPTLLRLTYHYTSEGKSKDNVLRAFFDAIGLSIDENTSVDFSDKETEERISVKLIGFADFLIDNFFLPLHCAIAHILHLSAAGAHIDRILEDTAGSGVHADGSTALGSMVQLRLDGWLDGWWDGREG